MSALMSAWRTWSLDKNFLRFRTRKKQSQANMEEQKGSRERTIYTELLRKLPNFVWLFWFFSLNYPSLYLFIQQKKTLTFEHNIPQVRRSLRRSPLWVLLRRRDSSKIRPKVDNKHGIPLRWNFLYKECFNRLFLTLNNMICPLDFINPLYQLF